MSSFPLNQTTINTNFYSSQTLRQLEQELHTEIYPGTEIMIDTGTHHFVKSSAGGQSVLVPQPSDDEHDPLVQPSSQIPAEWC
jgi:hypothetical protein